MSHINIEFAETMAGSLSEQDRLDEWLLDFVPTKSRYLKLRCPGYGPKVRPHWIS